jgi:hypothetical protein
VRKFGVERTAAQNELAMAEAKWLELSEEYDGKMAI